MDELNSHPSTEEICAHYGYDTTKGWHSHWPNIPGQLDRLSSLPEFIKDVGLDKRRFRVTFDYDPDYPNMLLQAIAVSSNPIQ